VIHTDTTVAGFSQPMRVAGLAYGPRAELNWSQTSKQVDFFDVKGDVESLLAPLKAMFAPAIHPAMHPGRCASVSVAGRLVGFVGELHPQWRQDHVLPQAPVLFELDLDTVLQHGVPVFQAVTKRQPVERDIAVIVAESVTHAALMAAISDVDTQGLLKSARVFDIYRPQPGNVSLQVGEKSLAVRLILGNDQTTLTDGAIEAAVQAITATLRDSLQARLRA
jgi:phenylalanyl-tRNA synthetase beta chain